MLKLRANEVEAREAFITALPVPGLVVLAVSGSAVAVLVAIFAAYLLLVIVMEIIHHN